MQSPYWFCAILLLTAHGLVSAQIQAKGALVLDRASYEALTETRHSVQGPLPSSATLELMVPQGGDQGDAPSCVAWATSYQKAYRLYQRSDRTKSPDSFLQS